MKKSKVVVGRMMKMALSESFDLCKTILLRFHALLNFFSVKNAAHIIAFHYGLTLGCYFTTDPVFLR